MAARDGAGLIAGRYRLVSELGSGAMGVVWLARDERLGRTVAVKELRAGVGLSGTQVQRSHLRARREARIAARLHHPHAVAIYDVVEHEDRPYLVMEYVASRSLAEVLAQRTVLTPAEAAQIGAQLASALVAAHKAGIVHRDIKPANILLTDDGDAKLTDFGISRANDDVTLTRTGEILGTPAYVAPEVAQGRTADAASDVFSLGATLYSAVEGVPPFGTGPTAMSLLLRIVNGEIRPPERIGPLTGTLMWMLRNDPADRPSMDVVRRSVRDIASSLSTDAAVTTPLFSSQPDPRPQAAAEDLPEPVGPTAKPQPEPGPELKSEPGSAPTHVSAETPPATPVSMPPSDPESSSPASPRRRLLPWLTLAVAAVVVAGVVAAIVASASPSKPTHSSSSTTATTATASPSSTATAAHATMPAASKSAAASSSASFASPTTSASNSPTSTAAQLTSAISHYYQLMPGNLDQAWGYLTADYQQNHAGGMSGYRDFWDQIQSVSASNIVASPPSTVTATIDYHYKSGKTVEESTKFTLVLSGGIWKIADTDVLSSRTL